MIKNVGVATAGAQVQATIMQSLSSYAENLKDEAKIRYIERRFRVINGLDLFGGCPGEPTESV